MYIPIASYIHMDEMIWMDEKVFLGAVRISNGINPCPFKGIFLCFPLFLHFDLTLWLVCSLCPIKFIFVRGSVAWNRTHLSIHTSTQIKPHFYQPSLSLEVK